jgi:hypothetical protein
MLTVIFLDIPGASFPTFGSTEMVSSFFSPFPTKHSLLADLFDDGERENELGLAGSGLGRVSVRIKVSVRVRV